jgi:hypothetical protein
MGMFQGAKLEIESVLREVCDRLLFPSPPASTSGSSPSSTELALSDQYVSKEKVRLRAVALQILGEAYMAVKKESVNEELGEGYVKIDVGGKPEQRR